MRRVRIQNPLVDHTYKTYLDAEYSSGVTATVKSTVSFAANDLIVYGEPTEEFSELKKLNSITAPTTFNLPSALNFNHNKETPVYRVLWDNVSIEGRSSSAGTFAELTQSAIQWDDKNNETIYYHSDGTSTWEYRFRFYNSVTATYSEYSPTITGATPARNTVQVMVENVRKYGGDPERKIIPDDFEIIRELNRAQEIIYAHNPRYWFLAVDARRASLGIAATADTDTYSLSSLTNFGHLKAVKYRYNSGGTDKVYRLRPRSEIEFDQLMTDQNAATDDWARFYKLFPADSSSSYGYLQIFPKTKNGSVGTIFPDYYEKMAELDTVDDTTQVPIPSILEDYAIAMLLRVKGDLQRAETYERKFLGPPDNQQKNQNLSGIALLDEMDKNQRTTQDSPRQLLRYRGQRAMSRLWGNSNATSLDQIREDQFDWV